MKLSDSLLKRLCPVCQSADDSCILFDENIDESKLNHLAFASRKTPEFMNFKLVCCPTCDLLYAHSIPSDNFLSSAYKTTGYDSDEEAHFAAKSYAKWLSVITPTLPDKTAALEIGSGNGAFLGYLQTAGFQEIIGVEPSTEAISAAPHHLKKYIRTSMFNVNDFPAGHFSLITIFQTLEHINEPSKFMEDALQLLKPGGALMLVAHNYRHWFMRLLGKKSPIIDIEHLQIFSRESLQFSLKKAGFQTTKIHSLKNTYPLHYWMKLMPIPSGLKKPLLNFIKNGAGRKIGSLNISMRVGNMVAWSYK